MNSDFKFTALSGGIPIGGFHGLIEVEGKRIAIDCGAAIRNNKTIMPPITDKKINLLLITHGHLDHDGALAYFAKHHPETKFLGTKVTRRFAEMMLYDSFNINNKKRLSGHDIEMYFDQDDIADLMSRFKVVRRPEWFSPWSGWQMRFVPNGHINGSAAIQIITPSGVKIMVSIDMCFEDQPTIKGADLKRRDFAPDVLIVEGTYGDRDLPPRAAEEKRFTDYEKRVLDRKGFVIVPSFSISGVNGGIISAKAGIPTCIDGMIRKAAFIVNESYPPWSNNDRPHEFPKNLIMVDSRDRERVLSGKPCAIVTTHGMLEKNSPVWSYLPTVLKDAKSAVLIPGYQAEETAGQQLLRLERGQALKVDHKSYDVCCDVERFHLSSHASGKEIARWVQEMNPWLVVVVHATKSGFEGLKRRIRERNPSIRVAPAYNGEEIVWE